MDSIALDAPDAWQCQHCGKADGVYVSPDELPLPDDARAVHCQACQAVVYNVAAAEVTEKPQGRGTRKAPAAPVAEGSVPSA